MFMQPIVYQKAVRSKEHIQQDHRDRNGQFYDTMVHKTFQKHSFNDHCDTFPSKCVTVVKDIIARQPLDVNQEAVIRCIYSLMIVDLRTPIISASYSFTI